MLNIDIAGDRAVCSNDDIVTARFLNQLLDGRSDCQATTLVQNIIDGVAKTTENDLSLKNLAARLQRNLFCINGPVNYRIFIILELGKRVPGTTVTTDMQHISIRQLVSGPNNLPVIFFN